MHASQEVHANPRIGPLGETLICPWRTAAEGRWKACVRYSEGLFVIAAAASRRYPFMALRRDSSLAWSIPCPSRKSPRFNPPEVCLSKWLGWAGATLGGLFGGWLGSTISVFAGFLLGMVGTAAGLYWGRRVGAGME